MLKEEHMNVFNFVPFLSMFIQKVFKCLIYLQPAKTT